MSKVTEKAPAVEIADIPLPPEDQWEGLENSTDRKPEGDTPKPAPRPAVPPAKLEFEGSAHVRIIPLKFPFKHPETGEMVRKFEGHSSDVWTVAFDQKGLMMATGSGDRSIKLWDLATGDLIMDVSSETHTSDVEELAFSPDGDRLVSVSRDGSIRFWEIPNLGRRIRMIVSNRVDTWSTRQLYEKTREYNKRMEEREALIQEMKKEIIGQMLDYYVENVQWDTDISLGEYNPDNEYYNLNSPVLGEMKMFVSINQAPLMAQYFDQVTFADLQMEYINGRLRLRSMDGFLSGINKKFKVMP